MKIRGVLLCFLLLILLGVTQTRASVQFEFSKQVFQENDAVAQISVVRVDDSISAPFSVDYVTADSTAMAGLNYSATQGTLAFIAGERIKDITIPILNDGQVTSEKRFTVHLNNPTDGIRLGSNSLCTVVIMDSNGMISHRFESVSVTTNSMVNLTLTGAVSPQYSPFLELYPIEVSADLLSWSFVGAVVQTNSSPAPIGFSETILSSATRRFYRTFATNLPTVFPPPTGPYSVGTLDRVLVDPSRTNRYGNATNSSFMASFWFPAAPKAGDYPNPLFKENLSKAFVSDVVDARLAYFRCMAFEGRLLATNENSYPVVIYSCGGGDFRRDNTLLALELASQGYIVVSIDHEDLSYVELPDGRIVSGTLPPDSVPTYKSRFQDMQILLTALETMNLNDSILRGGLDLNRIGVCGWSSGGVCAAELCLEDDRIKAGVLLDPGLISYVPHLLSTGIAKPFLVITGELSDGRTLYDKAIGPAYWLHIAGSAHANMGMPPVVIDGGGTNRRLQQVLQAYARSMMDTHFRQHDDHLLDGPTPAYPEVTSILRKNL